MSAALETPANALFDAASLRAIEARAAQLLGDEFALMQRAGQAAWRELLDRWPKAQRLLVVCGPGNNGGDGYVLATHARSAGREVRVLHLPEHAPRGVMAQRAHAGYADAGGRTETFTGELPAADVVVDALFGIGLSRAPDSSVATMIAAVNAQPAPVFALDVPSGVDAGLGSAPGVAINAQHTLEFIARKMGLCTGTALDHAGSLALATLDLPAAAIAGIAPVAVCVDTSHLSRWLSPRTRDSHKGSHGRVLAIGGDHGAGGAIVLCAQAALRSGAGLVEVVTRQVHVAALLARLPEAMAQADDAESLAAGLARADCVAVGPGLGQGSWGQALFARALAAGKPLLLDADALNLLAVHAAPLPPDSILTPHPGEAARLLGISTAQVQQDRYASVHALRDRHGCVVVLKGAGTLIAAPGETTCVIAAGNPGMAVGGMGDVLSGVIAALRAQGLRAFDAAVCGALLHAAAGDAAARDGGERGLLPSDLMPWLRRLANPGGGR
ncbi:NAD(P)H-hydrate dehydratase [Lysobacter koreensis]|uniref:Bifunctional NAD(P)H-hydrate repair enzyme n=1 Tax=Lysobacter koreensis TaxID=266122 RepID=A0ABW2YM85_9GAMM